MVGKEGDEDIGCCDVVLANDGNNYSLKISCDIFYSKRIKFMPIHFVTWSSTWPKRGSSS